MANRQWLTNGPQANEPYVIGTCEVGLDTFGAVVNASLKREHDVIEIKNCCGDTIAALLKNSRYTLSIKAQFPKAAAVPGDGDNITFPGGVVNVVGSIMSWQVDWENEGVRQISIEATHWSAIGTPTKSTFACP
jgi:hypothetical protein